MELNFEGFKMQKWNTPKDGAQRVDEKNAFNCLAMTLTNGVTVIKMSKMSSFLYFLSMIAKGQSQFGQNISAHLKNFI